MITSAYPLVLTISSALSAILLASTANTFFAPARAANRDRIPVPQPTENAGVGKNKGRVGYRSHIIVEHSPVYILLKIE